MNNPNHPSDLDLDLSLDEGLEPARQHEVAAHLQTCAVCRQRLGEMERLFSAITPEAIPDEPLPRDLTAGVLGALAPARGRDAWRDSRALRWTALFQASLALALLVLFIPTVLPDWLEQVERTAALLRLPDAAPILAAVSSGLAQVLELFRAPLPISTGKPYLLEILAAALVAWLLANGLLFFPRRNR